MFVAKRMTKNPVTVSSDTGVEEASEIMKRHDFRRLPVVDDGKLVGFVSDKDIMKVAPSPATTLSRYEIRTLLDKIKIRDIMNRHVITVSDDATIEEAALIMYKEKIGGLPVVSSVGAVVGVITETDIFKTLVDVMGLVEGTTRFTIEVTDKIGVVSDLAAVFTDNGYSIDSLVTCKEENGKYEIVIRGKVDDPQKVIDQITAKGYNVIHHVKIG